MIPTHRKSTLPGKILVEEFLIPLCISQSDFAKLLGDKWTEQKLDAIISGKTAITVALDFAKALGTSHEFWTGFQFDTPEGTIPVE